MDEATLKAMTKWPNVPAVFGWLRLDARGQWYLIDRNAPGFDASNLQHLKGSPITSPGIVDHIGRNYACDEKGRWYWQNGPQRAFAELDIAPLVYRVLNRAALPQGAIELASHTGYPVQRVLTVALDQAQRLWVLTEQGPGIVHDLDASNLGIEDGPSALQLSLGGKAYAVVEIESGDRNFDFVRSPLNSPTSAQSSPS